MTHNEICRTSLAITILGLFTAHAWGQATHIAEPRFASNIIVPQARLFTGHGADGVQISDVTVGVVIVEQAATTTMDISLRNHGRSRTEAELIVPVPDGAVVRGFSFQGGADKPVAHVLPRDEARLTYDRIVARLRDPALMEFVGYNLIRTSVFPVEARGTQKVRLTYEHLLPAEGDRIDYLLPRSESLEYSVPWKVSVKIESKQPISTVYSPSHALETIRRSPHTMSVRIAEYATREPGAFRLSYLLERGGVTASLLAYPEAGQGGGYFLLLAGLPATPIAERNEPATKRDVTLVLDRSGSMNGEKIEQAREAALQVLAGLEPGEAFNIITYNDVVERFANPSIIKTEDSVRRARAYLRSIRAGGGTNLHAALTEALRVKPASEMLPIVLFLTDGLPTVGQTSELAIRDVAINSNPYERRVYTFGVGVDVNTPLLERIAYETRATPTFVLPNEDVEVKVAQVFKRLAGPVLAGAKLEVGPGPTFIRARDMIPDRIPDLFEGSQLVVLGRYVGEEPLTFRMSGNYLGRPRVFEFAFNLDHATTRNAFVPRLWASRRIAILIDAIRQSGADLDPRSVHDAATSDPQTRELVNEIVRLSTEFGILTEYTAFLAREGTDLSNRDNVLAEANRNFVRRAKLTRSGTGSVNQSANSAHMRQQSQLNHSNAGWDENMQRVSITNVQQINDRAFYRRSGRWVDSRIVNDEDQIQPRRIINFGSAAFRDLAARLAREGRQGTISLRGDVLMVVDGQPVLVRGPGDTPAAN